MEQKDERVTRTEFVRAVRDFKARYGGKLKDLLNKEKSPEAAAAFWADPVIIAYLARPAMVFVDKHPQLLDSTTKDEHDGTDHYELKIYKYLPGVIDYRDANITTPTFYTQGTRWTLTNSMLRKYTDKGFSDVSVLVAADRERGTEGDALGIHARLEISDVAQTILSRPFQAHEKNTQPPRFLLFNHGKDNHFTAIVSIIEPNTQRALMTLLVNSSQNPKYFDKLHNSFRGALFNASRQKADLIDRSKVKQDLQDLFTINLDDPVSLQRSAVLTTPAKSKLNEMRFFAVDMARKMVGLSREQYLKTKARAACVIDPNYKADDVHAPVGLDKVKNRQDIDKIYIISKDNVQNIATVAVDYRPEVQFVDASHHLQIQEDDRNCGLYSFNFIQAMVEMLKSPAIAEQAFTLAKAADSGDKNATQALCNIFRDDLKTYLPCYYEASGQAKSQDELSDFHLQQRWKMGGLLLSILYPPVSKTKANDLDAVQINTPWAR